MVLTVPYFLNIIVLRFIGYKKRYYEPFMATPKIVLLDSLPKE